LLHFRDTIAPHTLHPNVGKESDFKLYRDFLENNDVYLNDRQLKILHDIATTKTCPKLLEAVENDQGHLDEL
jgi:hypothetical protein